MVWDNSYEQHEAGQKNYCASTFPNNPYVCGATSYTVPPQYTRWADLSGTVYNISQAVPFLVGLNPVLLEP